MKFQPDIKQKKHSMTTGRRKKSIRHKRVGVGPHVFSGSTNQYVSLVMGMGYSTDEVQKYVRSKQMAKCYTVRGTVTRKFRDAIRIGELEYRGHYVICSCIGRSDKNQTVHTNFNSFPWNEGASANVPEGSVTRARNPKECYATVLTAKLPPGRKLDFIMLDWYSIPRNFIADIFNERTRYHFGIKHLNVVQCAQWGLLNKGCRYFVHCHIDALEYLLRPVTVRHNVLRGWPLTPWMHLKQNHFTPRVVTYGELQTNPNVHPLWESSCCVEGELGKSLQKWSNFYATDNLCGQKGNGSGQPTLIKNCRVVLPNVADLTEGILTLDLLSLNVQDHRAPYFIEFKWNPP